MSSADSLCKQFGPGSGLTKCRQLIAFANSVDPDQAHQMLSADNLCKLFGPGFESKLFDNLMAFLKEFFFLTFIFSQN